MQAIERGTDAFLMRARRDPVYFCREALGIEPWTKQREVLEAVRDHGRVAVRSGHGTGKSFIAASAALWFLYSHYPAKVITTAPTWNQVRAILWNEIRAQHAAARIPLGGTVLEERLKLGPGAFAVGLSTDETERFQGYHAEHVLVILDEAPGVRDEIWEAAETLLTGRVARMLAIGNPTRASGRFYGCFAPASGWTTVHISCTVSPNLSGNSPLYPSLVTGAWIDERRRLWGEKSPFYRSRVLGEFPEEGDGSLVSRATLADALTRPLPPRTGALRLGIDVARTGADATVLCVRDDGGVRHLENHDGWNTMETAGRAVRLMRELGLAPEDVFIDDTGLGAGVVDRLREQEYPVNAVVLGARATDPAHFSNVRAECFWRLRSALEGAGGLSLAGHDEIARELGETRYGLTSAGAIRIESKETLRARLDGSPDHADALALTFAETTTAVPCLTVV